ncbi:MAG TPA: ATP synthase F1 subunit epsilon [Thermoanaerobaculia bacterium]|nr:ATP synthase F1 subunit epsilon [Thermoanaerobaculia bacterium]
MAALKLQVVTPERLVVETDADEVQLPGSQGYLGILPGHTQLLTLLRTGVLSYRRAGAEMTLAVSPGLAEISNDQVSVLADSAETPGEIDAAAAEQERSRAEKEMATASAETLPEIQARFAIAQARLSVTRRG